MEDVTVTQYVIGKCGFYLDEKYVFGSPDTTFSSFVEWVGGLASVGESSTYTPREDDQFLRTFCLDVRDIRSKDAFLLVTWNESENTEDGVQVIEINSKIGEVEVSAIEMDAMALPGYPAFFVVEPGAGRVINIRFEHRLNGSRQFQRFLTGYLSSFSPYCVWNQKEDRLVGYQDIDATKISKGVEASFATKLQNVGGRKQFLRDRCGDIRKVIRRASVSPQVEDEKSFIDQAFRMLGWGPNNRLRAEIAFEYQFKTKVTPEKLESIISEYEKHSDDAWSDVGFTLARDSSKVHWLSGAVARGKGQIDVGRVEGGMIDVDTLETYIRKNLGRLIAMCQKDD